MDYNVNNIGPVLESDMQMRFNVFLITFQNIARVCPIGCFPTTDMQTRSPAPQNWPSSEMHIKDALCPKKMMGIKLYITSYRVWALRMFKGGVLGV